MNQVIHWWVLLEVTQSRGGQTLLKGQQIKNDIRQPDSQLAISVVQQQTLHSDVPASNQLRECEATITPGKAAFFLKADKPKWHPLAWKPARRHLNPTTHTARHADIPVSNQFSKREATSSPGNVASRLAVNHICAVIWQLDKRDLGKKYYDDSTSCSKVCELSWPKLPLAKIKFPECTACTWMLNEIS